MKKIFLIIIITLAFFLISCGIDDGMLKIGATYMAMSNPYFEEMNDTIRHEIELRNGVLITRDPVYSKEKQIEQIYDMIDLGIDALILNPVDYAGMDEVLRACNEKDVPVFCVDTTVENSELIVNSILSDNYDAGVKCAQDLLRKASGGKIVIIKNKIVDSTVKRVDGFLDTLKNNKNFEVIEIYDKASEFEESMLVMDRILMKNIDFDVIFASNDPTALGVVAALQKNNISTEGMIYCVDGSPDGKRMVKAGYIEATCAQYPKEIGTIAVKKIYDYFDGVNIPREITVPVKLLTEPILLEDEYNNEWYK
ncbi:MAG: substrate-binding domain-containing protein [Lachnospirales bacterium]